MEKTLAILLVFTTSFPHMTTPTMPLESINDTNELFFEEIIASDYYDNYQKILNEIVVDRIAYSGEDMIRTITFSITGESESMLTFIGNYDSKIIDVLMTETNDNGIAVYDLYNSYRTHINFSLAKGPIYQCDKTVCTAYATKIGAHNDFGCSMLVGQACNSIGLLGKPIQVVLCKLGVWIACRISVDKVCTNVISYPDVCSI